MAPRYLKIRAWDGGVYVYCTASDRGIGSLVPCFALPTPAKSTEPAPAPTPRALPLHAEEFVGHQGSVNCIKIGRKSSGVLVTGGEDKKVNLWTIGTQTRTLVGPAQPCSLQGNSANS
jgi:WD40 repeat protein